MSRYDPNARRDDRNDDDREEVRQLRRIGSTLNNIHSDIHQLTEFVVSQPPGRPTLGAFIAAIHGRRITMAISIPVPKLLDTEKVQLSVMPRKADGHVDATAAVSWTAADPSQIEVGTAPFDFNDPQFSETVACPGNFNCWALTPGASGTGTVTVSAPGYESAEFAIEWAPGVARSLNASTGTPVADTDVPPTP